MPKRVLLGQVLLETGALTEPQLERALQEQRTTKDRLGDILLRAGLATQDGLAAAAAQQLGIGFIRLADTTLDEHALLQVPEHFARRHRAIPIRLTDDTLVVGMVDPMDIVAIDDLHKLTGKEIETAVITADDFQRALNQYPALDSGVDQLIQEIKPAEPYTEEEAADRLRAVANEVPLVRLVNTIILQAVRRGASDIHVEPQEHRLRIRYRIDGTLYPVMTPPAHIHPALVSRLKIMGNMNIAERRLPQDGRAELVVDNRPIDLRMATIPTVWGEKIVLRILEKHGAFIDVEKLGLLAEDHRRFERLIAKPYGILLLTGPTGSGKTTTQYAILNRLNRTDVNIVTIEDPVEYQLPGISQVQVNVKAGVTFASGLRSFLRQDPDIIMVGEIRDEETARIAIHAALTGHLVLSTLHTNDAPGAVTRLVDMGIEPFLVSSSVIGIIAQRLVRVLCPRCKEPYTPTREFLLRLGLGAIEFPTLYRPIGCQSCNYIGYKGRTGIFEIMTMDQAVMQRVSRHASSSDLREAAVGGGMRTLQHSGLAKVLNGTTSLDEVLRVVFVEDNKNGKNGKSESNPPGGTVEGGPRYAYRRLAPRDHRSAGV